MTFLSHSYYIPILANCQVILEIFLSRNYLFEEGGANENPPAGETGGFYNHTYCDSSAPFSEGGDAAGVGGCEGGCVTDQIDM
jgi:hypothetical protein